VQIVGINSVTVGSGAAAHLLLKPETLNVMKGVDQRRQLLRCHPHLLAADA
jgi:hypothetical protein